jgi:hypothetical protein
MQHIARFLCLLLLLAAASVVAPYLHAQDTVNPFLAFAKVDSSHFPTVQLAVYGDPGSGGIGELPVQVRENDQVQTVISDKTEEVGTQLAVVLDPHDLAAVGSSGQTHQAEVAGILLDLIEKGVVVRNQDWLAAFTGDSSGAVNTIQNWTGEPNLIFNSTVQSSADPSVDDNQLTALMLGVLDKFQAPAPANLARAILLFTAGSSTLDVESAAARANSANVRIHVIELANPTAPPAGDGALRDLATRTNGAFVRLQGAEDLPAMWRRLAALRNQRVLSYASSAAAPVSLTVELAAPGGAPLAATTDLAVPAAPQAASQAAPAAGETAGSAGNAAAAAQDAAPIAAPTSVPATAAATAPAAVPTTAPTVAAPADAPADAPAADVPATQPTAASNDIPAASEVVAVAVSGADQPSSLDDPATPAGDTAPAPASDTVFVPGTSLALPRPLLELALPILLVMLAFFAFREVRERRKSSKQQRDAAATKAPPAVVAAASTAAPAAEDDLDDLQPVQPRKQPAGSTSEMAAASAIVLEPSAAGTPAPAQVEDDDYDEATVVPLRFNDDEATYRLRETIDMPLLGVLVRVTNDPNLPQQLPVYGLNPGPGEARQIHIGRHSKNNTVVINDKSISREHAVIIQKDGRLYLRDNASTAGTYLNWRQLKPGEELLLRHNDLISFGEIVYEFRAKGEDEATVVSG